MAENDVFLVMRSLTALSSKWKDTFWQTSGHFAILLVRSRQMRQRRRGGLQDETWQIGATTLHLISWVTCALERLLE
jgi:hypothetical protein